MTDVPRRSYPLVVPPPGGFEEAVRRGRGIRRRRTGSSAGAALALVGALSYTLVANDPDTSGLQPTKTPPTTQQPAPVAIGTPPPEVPTASPAATRPATAPTTVATGPVGGPVAGPSGGAVAPAPPRATRRPNQPPAGRPYAVRGPIDEEDQAVSSTECLPEPGRLWCAHAQARPADDESYFDLAFILCRSIDASPGTVRFDRVQEAEYAVVDIANNDTVWTYSKGQPVVRASSSTTVDGGYCVEWVTRWNGYDDFNLTPRPGKYRLVARSTGTAETTLGSAQDDFEIGED